MHPAMKSRTLAISIMTMVAGVCGYLSGDEWIKTNPQAVSVLTVMLGAVNFALRVVTDRAIDGIFRSPEDD